ncbi:hypothetical protein E2P81_ATG11171 [Venturia nashicola]|uniref:Uncharacterized protein n=1 Tax=Venturia nashicola TaxID=86259 RepID=A0A4Z1PGA9_9PEZI|nr:hypothetical protein E6O75_ATG10854 [Venturia nashicola]TLD35052.1 hypothetical protein E2P81_ATG11171 [Venturia nashicola]
MDPEIAATTSPEHKTPTDELPADKSGLSSEPTSTDKMNIALPEPFTERESSPPMVLSPGLALDACPQLDRSVSTASSISSRSRRSSSSRLSDSGLPSSKRRGYMRPQATFVAESAKNRESVMSLGSIAHLQYYFARTGLLDGKGAQFAKDDPLGPRRKSSAPVSPSPSGMSIPAESRAVSMGLLDISSGTFLPTSPKESCAVSDGGFTDSPFDQEDDLDWEDGEMMLPPTVSTYNQRPIWVQPPPDLTMLRRELTEALEDAIKVLKETDKSKDDTPGWYEIQGLHLLDITTLAIRAAKNYYTAHTSPQRLYSIKSEREIRAEGYQVLDILKRMAVRNFAGGIRQPEKVGILTWIVGVSEIIQTEINQEKKEQEEREKWSWRVGEWVGKEREREWMFLRSFIDLPDELPGWDEQPLDSATPTPFLEYFQSGLRLVHLHNALVAKSKRHFEEIKVFHTETSKPYRMAENLRFWVKAAQLRWEISFDLDVMGVVHGDDAKAWRQFDEALLKWCKGVRAEITAEWLDSRSSSRLRTPALRVIKGSVDMSRPRSRGQSEEPTGLGVPVIDQC